MVREREKEGRERDWRRKRLREEGGVFVLPGRRRKKGRVGVSGPLYFHFLSLIFSWLLSHLVSFFLSLIDL